MENLFKISAGPFTGKSRQTLDHASDADLLKWAAQLGQALGMQLWITPQGPYKLKSTADDGPFTSLLMGERWNPLLDEYDAAEYARVLANRFDFFENQATVLENWARKSVWSGDPYKETRRAVVLSSLALEVHPAPTPSLD